MSKSLIGHPPFGSADLSFRKRFRLFFIVAVVGLLLSAVKTAVKYFGLELLQLNSLFTSGRGDLGCLFFTVGGQRHARNNRSRWIQSMSGSK